jgi:hypothetical protein
VETKKKEKQNKAKEKKGTEMKQIKRKRRNGNVERNRKETRNKDILFFYVTP